MAKERIRPSQFASANIITQGDEFSASKDQLKLMEELFEGQGNKYRSGQLVTGKILSVDSNGVLVDINYKSNGMIPLYEFSEHEIKEIKAGSDLEVIIDDLENAYGDVVLSYENAKAMKAWDRVTKLFEDGEPVEGVVTHKVKGGLSVDVGVPAFLPGSQVDLYRVTDFDAFVGQTVIADIIKLNKKRGNIIISRRKHLSERREKSRKQVLDTLEEGKVIQGVVKNITNYGVFIDVGGVDGLLHITDMTWGRISHPSEVLKIGETVTVKILSIDKNNSKISLGMKQLGDNPWKDLDKEVRVGSIIKGTIASVADYGLFVSVKKGVEGLVHISEISWTDRITDLKDRYKVGEEIEVLVVSLDVDNRRMSLSVKQLDKDPWSKIKEDYKEGDKIAGKITNIADFGVFVQIVPGVDGLVHVSDLSWTEHVSHPSDLYRVGDNLDVSLLSINEENKKIALSVKHLTQDPWADLEKEYPVGSIVKGTVTKIGSYGAFVKLPNKIEGLVYKSDLDSYKGDAVEVGQERDLRVVNINVADRKIGLSLKLEEDKNEAPRRESRPTSKRKQAKSSLHKQEKSFSSESNMKSALQLELEKHAAKQKLDKKDGEK